MGQVRGKETSLYHTLALSWGQYKVFFVSLTPTLSSGLFALVLHLVALLQLRENPPNSIIYILCTDDDRTHPYILFVSWTSRQF